VVLPPESKIALYLKHLPGLAYGEVPERGIADDVAKKVLDVPSDPINLYVEQSEETAT